MQQRFDVFLSQQGISGTVRHLEASTRTAADAARALGCTEAQIGKSILFRTINSKEPILVIASGPNRISEGRIAQLIGEPIEKADAAYVREKTGFAIGGVPPFGHPEQIRTCIDTDLFHFECIYVAAGTPHAIIALTPAELRRAIPAAIEAPVSET